MRVVKRRRFRYDDDMIDVVAGFDIGGTKLSLTIADLAGSVMHRSIEPTDAHSDSIEIADDAVIYHGLSEQLQHLLHAAIEKLGNVRVHAIGIVSAGPIRDGSLWNPTNIVPVRIASEHRQWIRCMPLVVPLSKAFSCPAELLNDCSAAVLGELAYGIGKDVVDKASLHLAYATISTGFGVGAWSDGRLVLGKDGNAGELGHVYVRKDGMLCGCGNRGCAETYCSGTGIIKNARMRLQELADLQQGAPALCQLPHDEDAPSTTASLDDVLESITPMRVFEAASVNDPLALAVLDDLVFAGGIAFSAIANAYDPEIIAVGGGIALAHPELLKPIEQEMRNHLNVRAPEVRLTPLGSAVTEFGAIAVAARLLQP